METERERAGGLLMHSHIKSTNSIQTTLLIPLGAIGLEQPVHKNIKTYIKHSDTQQQQQQQQQYM